MRKSGSYFCKAHKIAVCKKHKALHDEGKQQDHIYEKLGQKLTAQRLAKIVDIFHRRLKLQINVQIKF